MWNNLPADLLVYLGSFLSHRDVRCLQATCRQWERTWTTYGLACPHPLVHQIDVCLEIDCINRHRVCELIEPFVAHKHAEGLRKISYRMIKFIVLWVPVRVLSSVVQDLRLSTLQRHCALWENSLVFWCNCRRYVFPTVAIRHVRTRARTWRKKDDKRADNFYVWCFLVLMISPPILITLSTFVGTILIPFLVWKWLYTTLVELW
jgi:hypothetical protein